MLVPHSFFLCQNIVRLCSVDIQLEKHFLTLVLREKSFFGNKGPGKLTPNIYFMFLYSLENLSVILGCI